MYRAAPGEQAEPAQVSRVAPFWVSRAGTSPERAVSPAPSREFHPD